MRVRHEAGPRQGCADDDTVKMRAAAAPAVAQRHSRWCAALASAAYSSPSHVGGPRSHCAPWPPRAMPSCSCTTSRGLSQHQQKPLCPLKHAVHSLYRDEACTGSDAPRLGASSTSTGSVIDRRRWLLARVADTMSTRSGQSIISRMCASRMHTTGIGGSALIAWSRILSSR